MRRPAKLHPGQKRKVLWRSVASGGASCPPTTDAAPSGPLGRRRRPDLVTSERHQDDMAFAQARAKSAPVDGARGDRERVRHDDRATFARVRVSSRLSSRVSRRRASMDGFSKTNRSIDSSTRGRRHARRSVRFARSRDVRECVVRSSSVRARRETRARRRMRTSVRRVIGRVPSERPESLRRVES